MARPIHKLTALTIARARRDGRYGDGGGLYLQVDGGSKSWLFRYKQNGQTRYMGFGPLTLVSVSAARAKALECRKLLYGGADPIAARDSERAKQQIEAAKALTFDACVDAYLESHKAGWRNPKHRQQWKNTLKTYASPVLGKLPVGAIDVGLVMRVIERSGPANRRRRVGCAAGSNPCSIGQEFVATALVKIRRAGKAISITCCRRETKSERLSTTPPCRTTIYQPLWGSLRTREGMAARALELLILTGVRTGDVIGNNRDDAPPMRWQHVDLKTQIWTIPKTKTNTEHRVPLSGAAAGLLKNLPSDRQPTDIVFPGIKPNEPLSNGSMLRVLDRMGRGDLTVHGFRATFKTWASECTSFAREVVEAALAHAISDQLEAAYRRGDLFEKRRRLMNGWAEFCTKTKPATGRLLRFQAAE